MLTSVYTPERLCLSEHIRALSLDRLPAECCTAGTLCGSFGTSTGACALYHVKGCPLRHHVEVIR